MKSRRKRTSRTRVRPLSAFQNLKYEIGRAAESGGTVHIALGNGGLIGEDAITSLAGLEAVEEIADTAVLYNAPPIITVGDPTLIPMAQDILREAHARHNLDQRYKPDQVRFLAPSPMAYAASAAALVSTEDITTNLLIGAFGPEVSLITDAGARQDMGQLAAAADPAAIGALFPAADHLAMGEELYAAGVQLTEKMRYSVSTKLEDLFLRPLLALGIIIMAVLGFMASFG